MHTPTDSHPAAPGSTVTRLMLASRWTPTGSAVEAALALRAELVRRHEDDGVRTALLLCGGWLVQWHEGPHKAVEAVWAHLRTDPACRHEQLLHCSQGACTLQVPVEVATLHAGEGHLEVANRLLRLNRENEAGRDAQPVEIWDALSAPCQLGSGRSVLMGPRDVVAVTSEDTESVELLRSLAATNSARVTYQRFASADPRRADVGAAYTDVHGGGDEILRVQALSRRALGHGLARLGLRSLQSVVLMLGKDGERATSVLRETASLLQDLGIAINVYVVSASGKARRAALHILAGHEVHCIDTGPGPAAVSAVSAVLQLGRSAAHSLPAAAGARSAS